MSFTCRLFRRHHYRLGPFHPAPPGLGWVDTGMKPGDSFSVEELFRQLNHLRKAKPIPLDVLHTDRQTVE
ncbi:MAG: hypothetical protein ABIG71_01630 [Candidatus Uhrbacteria bacterium]